MFTKVIIAIAVLQVIARACPVCVKYNNPYAVHSIGTEMDSKGCSCMQDLSECPTDAFLCPAGQQCVIKSIPTCTFPPCTLQSAVCEPFTSCPAVSCTNLCPVSGYILDPNNCQTCSCKDPCKDMTCPPGQQCIKTNMIGTGYIGKCYDTPSCPACVKYANPFSVDYYGTEMNAYNCSCQQGLSGCPTYSFRCPAGQQCVMKSISTCTFPECKLKSAVCETFTSCPTLACTEKCSVSGYIKDPNNCQTCSCVDPCKDLGPCPAGQKCVPTTMIGTGIIGKCYSV